MAATLENARTYTFADTSVRRRDVEGWNPLDPQFDYCRSLKRVERPKEATFRQKTAKKRDFIETLLLECDIGMHEKLFN